MRRRNIISLNFYGRFVERTPDSDRAAPYEHERTGPLFFSGRVDFPIKNYDSYANATSRNDETKLNNRIDPFRNPDIRKFSRMTKSAALCLLLLAVVGAEDHHYQRDLRQSPIFFQPSRGGPPPKGQPFPGTIVPKFVTFGGAPPQGFRPAPQVDEEEEEEIDKNSIAPSPSTPPQQQVLHFRQSQPPQQQVGDLRPNWSLNK